MNTGGIDILCEAVLDSLFSASWQGGLAAVLTWGVCRAIPRLPAAAKAWLWRLVFLKMAFALIPVRPMELAVLPQPRLESVVTSARSQPVDFDLKPGRTAGLEAAIEPIESNTPEKPGAAVSVATPTAVPGWTVAGTLRLGIVLLWLLGVVGGLSRMWGQFRQVRWMRREARRCSAPQIEPLLISVSRALSLSRPPRLFISESVHRPMLIGLVSPTLIFPERTAASASTESLQMMIAHELAHIRRGDMAWAIFAAIVNALLFFHPLAWLSRRELIVAQESACDETVLRITLARPSHYAEMLLQVVSIPVRGKSPLGTLGVVENLKTLERRIRTMKYFTKSTTRPLQLATALLVGTALLALIPIRIVAAKSEFKTAVEASAPANLPPGEAGRLLDDVKTKSRLEVRQILSTVLRDKVLEARLQDLAKAEQDYAKLAGDYSDEHPEVRKVANVMRQVNQQIETRVDGLLAGLQARATVDEKIRGDDRAASDLRPVDDAKTERELLQLEINQLKTEIATAEALFKDGRESSERVYGLRAELYKVERELADLTGDTQEAKESLDRLIESAAEQLETQAQRVEEGVVPASSTARLRREVIRLKREKLALEKSADDESPASIGARQAPSVRTIPIYSRNSGPVEKVHVQEGELVQKDQVLIELDSTQAKNQVAGAKARQRIVQADLQIARAELEDSMKQLAIWKKKIEVGAGPPESEPNIERAKANVVKAEAQLELADVELKQAEQSVERLILKAPVDGRVKFIIAEGYFVPEGTSKILAELEPLDADANVDRKVGTISDVLQDPQFRTVVRALDKNSRLRRLEGQKARLRAEEEKLLLKYTASARPVIRVREQIQAIEEKIQEEQEGEKEK